jgi:hypothetical protein
MRVSQVTVIAADTLNSIIFLVFLVYWKIKSDRAVSELISEDALPSYYTVEVRNLPRSYSEETIAAHFQGLGADVARVATVYSYESVLCEVGDLIMLVDRYESANVSNK